MLPVLAKRFRHFWMLIFAVMQIACAQKNAALEIPISNYSGKFVGLNLLGEVVDAKTWIDKGDSNVLLVTKVQEGNQCEKSYVNRLFAYHLIQTSGIWSKDWEIKDFGPGPCYKVRFQPGTIRVFDVDGVEPFETLFFYGIAQDGAEPATLKMMFHWNGKKRPIRGLIPLTPDDREAYRMIPDTLLSASPKVVKDFAEEYWNQYVAGKYGITDKGAQKNPPTPK